MNPFLRIFLIDIYIPGCSSLEILDLLQFKLGLINSGSGSDLRIILAPAPISEPSPLALTLLSTSYLISIFIKFDLPLH